MSEIVTAWAEAASGPGWSNPIVWLLVRDARGALSVRALQPDEQTDCLRSIHKVAAQMTNLVVAESRKVKR